MAAWLTIALFAALAAPTPADDARAAAVLLAQQALAQALGVGQTRVRVDEVRAVEWPNAALGCPEKGRVYAEGIVPGYRVRLEVDRQSHGVHVGNGRAVICDLRTATEKPKYFDVVRRVQDLARRDLADRLKVEVKEIKVLRLRPALWPDKGLGCSAGDRYEAGEVRGFVIELSHADKTFRYHSDQERVVFCER